MGVTELKYERTQAQTMPFMKVEFNDNNFPLKETQPIDMTRQNRSILDQHEARAKFGERPQNMPFQFDQGSKPAINNDLFSESQLKFTDVLHGKDFSYHQTYEIIPPKKSDTDSRHANQFRL